MAAEGRLSDLSYLELLRLAAPEAIVVLAALAVLAVDLMVMREEPLRNRFWVGAAFAGLGCLLAIGWLLTMNAPPHGAPHCRCSRECLWMIRSRAW